MTKTGVEIEPRKEAPKDVIRILVADNIPEDELGPLVNNGYLVDFKPEITPAELLQTIGDYQGLVVRSRTKATSDVIRRAENLRVIARVGVGVDNIDVEVASSRGILVLNTPEGNTNSAAELAIAHMLSVTRHIPQAHQEMVEGMWTPTIHVGTELRGKTLGVVGFGNIGTRVAELGNGLGMKVIACDPYGSEERAKALGVSLETLDTLLKESDFVSLHVPLNENTSNLIGEKQLARMKNSAFLINTSRGEVVDEEALVSALETGQIAGAGLDVFVNEGRVNKSLSELPNVTLTPHLGASTKEAQKRVAAEAVEKIIAVFKGESDGGVNVPRISKEAREMLQPYVDVASNLAKIAITLLPTENVKTLEIGLIGKLGEYDPTMLRAAALSGLLEGIDDERVNVINYRHMAKKHGINITDYRNPQQPAEFVSALEIDVRTDSGPITVAGVYSEGRSRVISINEYEVEFPLSGHILIYGNADVPGIIGKVGTLLGRQGVNINRSNTAQASFGKTAVTACQVDRVISTELLKRIRRIRGITSAHFLTLG